jgi:hypothetical protein
MGDFRKVLNRAQSDYEFYLSLLANPREQLASYALSETELAVLTADRGARWSLFVREPIPQPPLRGLRRAGAEPGALSKSDLPMGPASGLPGVGLDVSGVTREAIGSGIPGVLHFYPGERILQDFGDAAIEDLMDNADAVDAVAKINAATEAEARVAAVAHLIEMVE